MQRPEPGLIRRAFAIIVDALAELLLAVAGVSQDEDFG